VNRSGVPIRRRPPVRGSYLRIGGVFLAVLATAGILGAVAINSRRHMVTAQATLTVAAPAAPGSDGLEPEITTRETAAAAALSSSTVAVAASIKLRAASPAAPGARAVSDALRVVPEQNGRVIVLRYDAATVQSARDGVRAVVDAYNDLAVAISVRAATNQQRAVQAVWADQEVSGDSSIAARLGQLDAASLQASAGPLPLVSAGSWVDVVHQAGSKKTLLGFLLIGSFVVFGLVYRLGLPRGRSARLAVEEVSGAPAVRSPLPKLDGPISRVAEGASFDRAGLVFVTLGGVAGGPAMGLDIQGPPTVLPAWGLSDGVLCLLAQRPAVLLVGPHTDSRELASVADRLRSNDLNLLGHIKVLSR
jgi:hypothetical protein